MISTRRVWSRSAAWSAAAAFILAPGLKLRVTGGFNYPNTQIFSFTLNYLIGSP